MDPLIEPPVGTKRGRGKGKKGDDTYWYEDDNIDGMLHSGKKRKSRTIAAPTAKLKFTHNYDAIQKPLPEKKTTSKTTPQKAVPQKTVPQKIFTAPPFEDPDRLYCYCRCPYDEVSQMIGCDANDCAYEWFHFECVGIAEAPEGQWYCPECRLRPKYRAQFDEPFFQPQPPPQQII